MTSMDHIFLLSSDRSGSNLVLRIMGSHPEITAPPTSQLLPNLYNYVSAYGDLSIQENWDLLLRNTAKLHKTSFGKWSKYADLNPLHEYSDNRSINLILREIFKTEAQSRSVQKIAIKAHRAYAYEEGLQRDFPNARFVYLVRDPRDMALSWWKTPGLRGGIMRASDIWKTDQAGFIQQAKSLGENCHLIKYEDILESPNRTLKKLCEFLDVSFEPQMLGFHRQDETQKISEYVQAWNNLSKPLMSQNINKYRTALTTEQWVYIEQNCKNEMLALGYKPDHDASKFDLESLANKLAIEEPWDKPEYASIPESEKQSHAKLREATLNFQKDVSNA